MDSGRREIMHQYRVKEINALARGLEVLKTLHNMRSASLHELHRETGIPKSTLTRILLTLHRQGYIWQRMVDGAFLTSHLDFKRFQQTEDNSLLVEVASPFMEALCEKVKWPSVLSCPRMDYMEVMETNSPRSYFDEIPLGPIGFRVPMLRSASGRAYLGFCPDQERDIILQRLREKAAPGNQLAWDKKAVSSLVKETRANGFAVRASDFGGDYDRSRDAIDDGRESIAVPIFMANTVIACMNITWRSRVISLKEARLSLLPALQRTVQKVSKKLEGEILEGA